MNKMWSEVINFVERGRTLDVSAQALGMATLLRQAFINQTNDIDTTVHDCSESGNIEEITDEEQNNIKTVFDYLVKKDGKLIYQFHDEKYGSYIFLWDNSIVELERSGSKYMRVAAHSLKKEFIIELREFIKPLFKKNISQGHVFAIVSRGGNLGLNSIGNAGIALERRNYSPEVIESYDYVIKDLNARAPSGRIVIMEGEPGTGKTHLVRGMLMDVPDAMFVLVSPDMVSSLAGPELLPLLLSHRENQEGPIILVLEDADKCLVTRQGDNINSIQSLLNLGDGILGSLLDLRIIATTNAKKLEMEQAILRPGRLSRRLEVGQLSNNTAKAIFAALCPDVELPILNGSKGKWTLAEIYSMARKAGWEPENRPQKENVTDPRSSYDNDDDE